MNIHASTFKASWLETLLLGASSLWTGNLICFQSLVFHPPNTYVSQDCCHATRNSRDALWSEKETTESSVSFPCLYLFMRSWTKWYAPSQALATQEDAESAEGYHHTVQMGQQRAGQSHCGLDNILQPGWQLLIEWGEKTVL